MALGPSVCLLLSAPKLLVLNYSPLLSPLSKYGKIVTFTFNMTTAISLSEGFHLHFHHDENMQGATRVMIADILDSKLALARTMGDFITINSKVIQIQ